MFKVKYLKTNENEINQKKNTVVKTYLFQVRP